MSPSEGSRTTDRHLRFATLAGIVTATLGLVVIAGWQTGTVALIQVLPTFVPMQYNTALGFLLSGVGLVALAHDRQRIVIVTGSVVGAIGILTLIEYVFGVTLGIDELLMDAYITVQSPDPGRMAPNTALSFSLSAAALLSGTLSRRPERRFWVGGGLGALPLFLGSVALVGYVAGAETAFGWERLTHMAVHTAVGFVILAAGIVALAFRAGSQWASASKSLSTEHFARDGRRIVAASVIIMAMASAAVGFGVIRELYHAELAAQRGRLEGLVRSRIELIEAISRFDEVIIRNSPGAARAAALAQVVDANGRQPGFGETGEYALATHDDGEIVFLTRPPQAGQGFIARLGSDEDRAEPMRRAVGGESGSVIGYDYRGEMVLAAYGHVPSLDVGIVAKMDLREFRDPFVASSYAAGGIMLIIIVIGGGGILMSIGPLMRRVERQSADRHRAITELTQARDELVRREALLTATGSLAKVGGWEVDAETLEVAWTEETFRIHELSVDDGPLLEGALDFYHEDDRPRLELAVQRALLHGEPFDIEARLTTATGRQLWTHSICEPLTVNGRTVKLRGAFQDITEFKEQNRTITTNHRISTIFLTSMAESERDQAVLEVICEALDSPSGWVAHIDEDGDLRCATTIHDGADPFLGTLRPMVIPRADWHGSWGQSLRKQQTLMVNDGLTSPSGSLELESALLVPLVYQSILIGHLAVANKPGGYADADRELLESIAQQTAPILYAQMEKSRRDSEHKELEVQFRHSQRMESVGQLAGGVAHDFNNLLQVIQGFGEIALIEAEENPAVHAPVEEMMKASDRAKRLVAQLLAFSRRQVLKLETLDLNDVVAYETRMLRRVIGEHIKLEVLRASHVGVVRADRGQLAQILMNLCVNARDAMPSGGTLTIEVEGVWFDAQYCETHAGATPGRYALLSVTDTGSGIDEEVLDNIFDPFFTTKEVGRGTGLGLATVYGLVKQHEGMIQVYSEVGKGTAFKIYLPISERSAMQVGDKVEGPVLGGTETILVAEDDEQVLELTRNLLEEAGYTVIISADGTEALRLLEESADVIDLALLDVVMPKLGGRAVFERIREEYPQVRVLFSSGYSINAIHTNFILDEGLTLLRKPHTRTELLRKVREVLDSE